MNSVAQFQALVTEIAKTVKVHRTTTQLWFRGQARNNWPLLPGLYRTHGRVDPRFERHLLRDFRAKSTAFLDSEPAPARSMSLMQHYGLPTRLIDWTTNSLVALFFAVEQDASDDACVWVLSPWKLNHITCGNRAIATENSAIFRRYTLTEVEQIAPLAEQPMAVIIAHSDKRIHAQDAAFTVHGSLSQSLETVCTSKGITALLAKVILPRTVCATIKRDLFDIGFHRGHLFPDLGGLAEEISYRYSHEYFAPDVKLTPQSRVVILESISTTERMLPFARHEIEQLERANTDSGAFVAVASSAAGGEVMSDDTVRKIATDILIEVKAHNEEEIGLGKRHGDLHYRIRNEIDKARSRFIDRLGDIADDQMRCFDDLLVAIVADGDRTLLKM